MSNARKFQTEIDRVMKKLEEGVDSLDDIWEKVYTAEQLSQKETHEMDLKKEIKNLQQNHDRIKSWTGSSDVKDQDAPIEARKLIEIKTEQFKICEKETKIKTYSTEGLARANRLSPEEEATFKITSWISEAIERLHQLVEERDVQIKRLGAGKGNKSLIEQYQQYNANHKFHISKPEGIMPLVNNDLLSAELVDEIKEELDHYMDAYDDKDYIQAYDQDMFYENLCLVEFDVVNVDTVTQPTNNATSGTLGGTNIDNSSTEDNRSSSKRSGGAASKASSTKKSNASSLTNNIPLTIGRARGTTAAAAATTAEKRIFFFLILIMGLVANATVLLLTPENTGEIEGAASTTDLSSKTLFSSNSPGDKGETEEHRDLMVVFDPKTVADKRNSAALGHALIDNLTLQLKEHEPSRIRKLQIFSDFQDPRTVNLKSEIYESAWRAPPNSGAFERKINVLSFGMSHTWGAGLNDPLTEAYPFLVGGSESYVENLALRATRADYPSVCLQSMIPKAENLNVDVVTLEFSICGDSGFELLLKRVRGRYPDAIIIFVHLWSLLEFVYEKDSGLTPQQLGKDAQKNWTFIDGKPCSTNFMVQLAEKYGAHVYKLPELPRAAIDEGWFQNDWYHPTKVGHLVIANGILSILYNQKKDLFKPKALGSFGLGDQCMTWYQDGGIGLPVMVDGMSVSKKSKKFGPSKKYAVEIDPVSGGYFSFESDFEEKVPFGVMHMSKSAGKLYTVVEIKVNNQSSVILDPNDNPHPNPEAHMNMLHQIGFAQPGLNTVSISTIEAREIPLRLTGIILCGVCAATGELGNMMQAFVDFDALN
jgi:hypothetical protein